jgi:biopolymer transport protein ExbB
MLTDMNLVQAMTSSPVLIALVLCSVVTFGVVLERLHYFHKRHGEPDALLRDVLDMLREGHFSEAVRRCRAHAHPLGAVAVDVLMSTDETASVQEERIQIALSQQKLLLERNLGVIGTMAAVAPLVGLLGTVWGIMRAFNDMALTGSAAPSVVAAGVAEALVTTAAGLVVAVPAVVLYNHFSRKMSVMLTVAENHARSIRTVVGDSGSPGPADPHKVVPANTVSMGAVSEHPQQPVVTGPVSMHGHAVQSK